MILALGDRAELARVFCAADVSALSALTGDGGDARHVPEPLLAALISCLLGTRLPGPGTNYLKQHLRFVARAALGQPITAQVTVTRLRADRRLVDLHTLCTGPDGALLCEGRALVLLPDPARWALPAAAPGLSTTSTGASS